MAGKPSVSWVGRLAAAWLGLWGWKIEAPTPPAKAVIVFYPHTSNWDFFIGILARASLGLSAHWVAKDSIFRWPVAGLLRWLGGIPVNRRQSTGFVRQLEAEFIAAEEFHLVIAPEGTRSLTPGWKSGFYHVARAAQVPVGLGFIDYPSKRVGIADYMELCGDEATDLARLAEAYADYRGKYPALQGPVSLVKRAETRALRNTEHGG